MSFSGGVYTLPGPALVTGEVVSATENNQFRNDVAGAFNVTMLRNGTSTATANLPMGGYKLTGLGVATTSGDALSYGQAAVISDLTASGTVTISSGTANGVAYLNGSKVLTTGSNLVFDGSNLGLGVTPSAWSGGFKAMQYLGGSVSSQASGYLYTSQNAYYNGTNWTYSANGGAVQYEQSNAQHQWKIAGYGTAGNAISFTQAMTLDASGNLMVGTTTPAGKFTLYGQSSASPTLSLQTAAGGSDTKAGTIAFYRDSTLRASILLDAADSGFKLNNPDSFGFISASTNNTERMRIDSSGNVGIGTTSTTNYILRVNATSPLFGMMVSGTQAFTIGALGGGGGAFYYGAGNAEAMRIDSSGNLLVGTTNQGSSNSMSWQVRMNDNAIVYHNCSTTAVMPRVYFYNPNGLVGQIYTSGTATGYATSSDYRLKENIQPMQNALATVAQLNPVTYTWKADGSEGQGFIAHELQAVVPDCVTGEKDGTRIEEYEITPAVPAVYEEVVIPAVFDEEGNVVEAERTEQQLVTAEVPAVIGEREVPVYQGVDTSFLVATLTKAIQELAAKVDAQQAEIDALKNTAA